MGVPRFFSWVNNNYNVIIDPIMNPHEFYIDLNCLLHPMCFEVAHEVFQENPDIDNDKLENKMFIRIIEYLQELLDYLNPTELIYIAVDGVAPMAKMKHQRIRRFKSVKEQEIRQEIMEIYKQTPSKKWNNAVITPGTNFMKKLSIHLLKFIKNYKLTHNIKIILSTSNTHGEGEHKIHQYLKEDNDSSKTKVVYGLDADLIFLTMATQLNKLYVFREAQAIDEKSNKKFLMVDIDLLKNGIFEDIQSKSKKKLELMHVINDYIMLGFFLGNDFLPNIPSLTLSPIHPKLENGLDIILSIYPEFINSNEYIYTNNKSLCKFLEILSNREEEYFKNVYNKGRIMYRTNETDPCKVALFQFDNLTLSDVNFLNIGKDAIDQYKKRYYNHFFHINYKNSKELDQICHDYFIGISWVKHYYFNTCPDWLWLYKHHQVPFVSDLYNYMKNNKYVLPTINIVDNIYSIKPLEQLLMVNPPENEHILPIECRSIFKNINLKEYFPKEYDFDIFMKTKFWMCYAEIPNPNYDDFKKEINKIKYNEESEKLNKNFKIYLI